MAMHDPLNTKYFVISGDAYRTQGQQKFHTLTVIFFRFLILFSS